MAYFAFAKSICIFLKLTLNTVQCGLLTIKTQTDSTIALRYGLLPTHLNINWTQLEMKIKSSNNLYTML